MLRPPRRRPRYFLYCSSNQVCIELIAKRDTRKGMGRDIGKSTHKPCKEVAAIQNWYLTILEYSLKNMHRLLLQQKRNSQAQLESIAFKVVCVCF